MANLTEDVSWFNLAKIVKDRREAMGLSRAAVASHGGPSDYTLARIERGDPGPYRPKTVEQLERGLSWPDGVVGRILDGTATQSDIAEVVNRSPVYSGLRTGVPVPLPGHEGGTAGPWSEADARLYALAAELVPLLVARSVHDEDAKVAAAALSDVMQGLVMDLSALTEGD